MATISDVAKASGLSVSTVSRVINNKPHVAEAKRQRVLEAMDQLGYAPLQAARQMRGSGSGNIAVAVPTITNPFFAKLVDSIEKTCRADGYRTLIVQTKGEVDGEIGALELLRMQHADGLVLCAIENEWDKILSYATYGALAVCNEYNDDDSVSMVFARQYEGFFGATQYLMGRGHKKIAYCTGSRHFGERPTGANLNTDRYNGYLGALKSRGVTANPDWLFERVSTMEDGRAVVRRILAMFERPDAIIAGSDEAAAGIELEAQHCRIRVPEDLAIIGVDDQPIASVLPVPLTTIRQPSEEEGVLVAKDLIRQLTDTDGTPSTPARHALSLELVVRSSA